MTTCIGMAREKRRGQAVRRGKHSVLRRDSGERFERFLRKVVIALVAGEGVHANQRDRRDGIRAWRGRILKRLAANVEAAHRRGVRRPIEKAAAFGVAVTGDRKVHRFLRGVKIARIERRFVGIEQRQNAENLIVERAVERGPSDAVAEAARLAPDFASTCDPTFSARNLRQLARQLTSKHFRRVQIRRNEHRVPANVHRLVDERSRPVTGAPPASFLSRFRNDEAHDGFVEAQSCFAISRRLRAIHKTFFAGL